MQNETKLMYCSTKLIYNNNTNEHTSYKHFNQKKHFNEILIYDITVDVFLRIKRGLQH